MKSGRYSSSALKENEQLFTGLKPIEYSNYEANTYADSVKEEMEFALASAPTGAFMGSSYFRTPFPVRLWIWNAFSPSDDALSRWITKVFGSKPKLMENVNPKLRAQVAEHQLDKLGYFNGKVDYEVITQSNPKEAKVAYKVNMGHLWRLDSVAYLNFPEHGKQLIDSTMSQAVIRKGSPFNVSNLEQERQRLTRLFRNHGYYFYQNGYASYQWDKELCLLVLHVLRIAQELLEVSLAVSEVIWSKAPYVHRYRSVVAYSNPLAFLVLVRNLTIDTHDLGTLYTSCQVLVLVLRADTTSYCTVLAQGVAYAETYHSILVGATLWKLREELADNHEAVTVVEVIAVDYAERLLDNVLCHQHCVVGTPWLLATLWYAESFRECIQRLEAKLCWDMALVVGVFYRFQTGKQLLVFLQGTRRRAPCKQEAEQHHRCRYIYNKVKSILLSHIH
jgi:hypothetical protein